MFITLLMRLYINNKQQFTIHFFIQKQIFTQAHHTWQQTKLGKFFRAVLTEIVPNMNHYHKVWNKNISASANKLTLPFHFDERLKRSFL